MKHEWTNAFTNERSNIMAIMAMAMELTMEMNDG